MDDLNAPDLCMIIRGSDPPLPNPPKLDTEPVPEDTTPEQDSAQGDFSGLNLRSGSRRLVTMRGFYWEPGCTIRVRCFGADPPVRAHVELFAREWLKYANLKMNFVDDGPADVRIAFDPNGGANSAMGTEVRDRPPSEPTMNLPFYASMEPWKLSLWILSSTILHEFGHVLGCAHEHMNPVAKIPWDKPKVYEYYAKGGWPRDRVESQVFQALEEEDTEHTDYDPASIMLYRVPAELTLDHRKMRSNFNLSRKDKAFIGKIYPKGLELSSPGDEWGDYFGDESEDERDVFPPSAGLDPFFETLPHYLRDDH